MAKYPERAIMIREFSSGRLIRVEYEVELPADASRDEVDAWIGFHLGTGHSGLTEDTPLALFEPEPFADHFLLTDTGMRGITKTVEVAGSPGQPIRTRYLYERHRIASQHATGRTQPKAGNVSPAGAKLITLGMFGDLTSPSTWRFRHAKHSDYRLICLGPFCIWIVEPANMTGRRNKQ